MTLVDKMRDAADSVDIAAIADLLVLLREAAAEIDHLGAQTNMLWGIEANLTTRLSAAERVVALVENFHSHGGVHHELAEAAIAYRRSEKAYSSKLTEAYYRSEEDLIEEDLQKKRTDLNSAKQEGK